MRATTPSPSLLAYAAVIARIGLTSFGGGISAWMLRVVVHEKGWMSETEFLRGLSICQVFPGVNVVNIALWVGYRLHGGIGALLGCLAIIVPPGLVLIGIAVGFAELAQYAAVRTALDGVAAAAIGLGASMGVRAARVAAIGPIPYLMMGGVFGAIGLLHLPLVPVVVALATLSTALSMLRMRRER